MIRDINKLSNDKFDVLIIGGGIHGAALAWLASLNGLYTALIEKQDFSQGASSNSQKIIHGGLRYLQQLDFPRISQSVNERKRLMWLAPHLIHPLECVMPIYGHGPKGKEAMRVGLRLYDFLSRSRNELPDSSKHIPHCGILTKSEINRLIPGLGQDGLRGGALWYDGYCYNTERLVVSFLKSATKYGAIVANYLNAVNLIFSNNSVIGVSVLDEISHTKFEIRAKIVVNCTGNAIDHADDFPLKAKKKVAGLNVIVTKLFQTSSAVGLQSRTGETSRLYFILPWREKSILGTEWFPQNGSATDPIIGAKHCAQLIDNFNKTYPSAKLKLDDISFIHMGLVPGNHSNLNDISTLKDFQIVDSKDHGIQGLVHVFGIKYTTAVFVAEQVMKKILQSYKPKALFEQPRLVGGDIDNFDGYKTAMIRKREKQFDSIEIERMVLNYGTEAEHLLRFSIDNIDSNRQKPDSKKIIEQEVLNAVRNEMALKLSDTILRRTDIGTAERPPEKDVEFVSKIMANQLNWNADQRFKEIEELKTFYPQFDRN